jgi:hypothetical protein
VAKGSNLLEISLSIPHRAIRNARNCLWRKWILFNAFFHAWNSKR